MREGAIYLRTSASNNRKGEEIDIFNKDLLKREGVIIQTEWEREVKKRLKV